MSAVRVVGLLWAAGAAGAAEAAAMSQGLTQEEALRLAFPAPAVIERRTAFLTEEQVRGARAAAGRDVPIAEGVVSYYVGLREGSPLGAAYFDRHRVRTLDEVVMIVVDPAGRVRQVEVLRFAEPPDYAAPARWLAQLGGRRLDDALSLKGSVVNLTGATLTSQALVRATRRVLALHQVIKPFGGRDERQ